MSSEADLGGLRIVITRPEGRGQRFAAALRAHGAEPILIPAVRIEPLAQVPGLEQALARLDRYDWVIFTSANGVGLFWNWLQLCGADERGLRQLSVAAIGPATADALRARAIEPDFVPDEYVGEALAEGLPEAGGKRVLLPRAAGSRPALPENLKARGAQVDEFHLYRATQVPLGEQALLALRQGVDVLTFTSPSTLLGFIEQVVATELDPRALPGAPITACIGPITAEAASRAGLEPQVVADDYTVDGLVAALATHYRTREAA